MIRFHTISFNLNLDVPYTAYHLDCLIFSPLKSNSICCLLNLGSIPDSVETEVVHLPSFHSWSHTNKSINNIHSIFYLVHKIIHKSTVDNYNGNRNAKMLMYLSFNIFSLLFYDNSSKRMFKRSFSIQMK